MQDGVTSRAIDAGNPGTPLGEEVQEGGNVRVNMGAYGGTEQASKTPVGWALRADVNNDGMVDLGDYAVLAGMWRTSGQAQACDLDRNGAIDMLDVCLLADDWLGETTWSLP